MTAPDRIWINSWANSKEPVQWSGLIHNSVVSNHRRYDQDEEYLRKGAFPVEELREALDDRYGPETAVAFRAEYKLMERILSLLEDSE